MPAPDQTSSLGTLVDAYLAWDGLEEEILRELAQAGVHSREALLPVLLERLPKEAGIKTIEELEAVLYDEVVFEALRDEVDPTEMGRVVCELIVPQEMTFAIPIARAEPLKTDAKRQRASETEPFRVDVGGRNALVLFDQNIGGVELACVTGSTRVGHWRPGMRQALSIAEEVSGVLMALDLLRRSPSDELDRYYGDQHVFDGLAAIVQYDRSGVKKTQEWPLPPTVQHSISVSVLGLPRRLNDLERAKLAQGAPGALDHRFNLLLRPFVVGGEAARRIRRAARFLRKAATSDTPADSFLFMATALESLLIPNGGEGLERRISDAVALLLGGTYPDRERLRKVSNNLYNVRSRYIHEGEYQGTELMRLESLRLVADVVAHEIRMLTGGAAPESPASAERQ